jgi:hypothetical protein
LPSESGAYSSYPRVLTVSYNLAIRYAGEYAQLEELIIDPAACGKNIGG